jgi:hypothetical protein
VRPGSLSFVIPVRDDATRLQWCLDTIRGNTPKGTAVEIVVADNGSTDGSVEVARSAGARVLILPGFRLGALRNHAAAVAQGEILAFVDADHEIGPDWIATAVELLGHRETGAVGAPCEPPSPATWVQRFYDRLRRHPAAQERVDWLGSGNMAVRRAAFEEVGGFDQELETCEDVDLCRKLRGHHYALLADRRLKNVHHGDPRTLGQVFYGELWRGRDNVRVSLRRPISARTLLSAGIPLANLAAMAMTVGGVLAGSGAGLAVAAAALGFPLVLITLRTSVMRGPTKIGEWPKAFAVAAAYEGGRALAVAGRFTYRRRRRAALA